jgi:hypothetical protein
MKKVAFTIVLNGMPFIKQQYGIIPEVFDEWIIVEGYSKPVKDTAWCKHIDISKFTNNGLSNDGTTEFLNSIKSDKIKIIRKPLGEFWNGKTEMCNAAIQGLSNCVLMEFDVDEIWSVDMLKDVLSEAEKHHSVYDVMQFYCNCYVGHNLITVGENCYGNNPGEWQRLWALKEPSYFVTHEPPVIHGLDRIVPRENTKLKGWIFDHYSYTTEAQLKFKEDYYGYANAVEQWKKLQEHTDFPCKLNQFLPWVDDRALVNRKD